MIKLILSDMDGTFLNDSGRFNKDKLRIVKNLLQKHEIHFGLVTGKQCERVEELFQEFDHDFYIVGDSATRIKHNQNYLYEALLDTELGHKIVHRIHDIHSDHTVIVCTRNGAYVLTSINESEKNIVRNSYASLHFINDFDEIED